MRYRFPKTPLPSSLSGQRLKRKPTKAGYPKLLLAAVMAMMLVATEETVAAGPMDDVNAAYKRGDFTAAKAMLRALADRGVPEAQYELGYMYYAGLGVPQDYVAASKWYEMAADRGFAEAQHDLGIMYLDGQGVTEDYVRAHMWLNLAASQLSDKDGRAAAVQARDFVASKMTAAEIAEAQRLAREWRPAPSAPSIAQNR
jgi:hypothetical protein